MASTIKVDKLEGSTGSTITVPTGQSLTLTDGLAIGSLPTVTVAKGGTNLTSFTAGDVLYATGSTTLAKLAKGTAEQVLAMNSGATAPDWGSVDLTVLPTITVAKGGTNLSSFTAGDVLYATGSTTLAKLAKGTATQVLTMNSGATAPEWAAAGGGIISSGSATDTSSRTTTSTSFTDASNTLALTMTPASTASKVFLTFTGNFGNNSTSSRSWLTMFRDSTNLAPNGLSFVTHEQGSSGYQAEQPCTIVFLDSPNTASQVVYSFQCKAQSGNTTYIGGELTGNTHYLEF